ncbi:MAG: helix-turn-helix domain-containing protein [Cetobacterium sp.]|uniref:winged helix-turn-helix transcriptional regulator n=1 Tax=Cetobacterium sp. TaxID=2071632 RepID=UPI002FC9058E
MEEKNIHDSRSCPVEVIAVILGKKWIPTIIFSLYENEELRLGEILKKLDGCSKKMLIQQLTTLMDTHIVQNKKIFKNNTVESYYYLSHYGKKLIPVLKNIKLLGCEYQKIECNK